MTEHFLQTFVRKLGRHVALSVEDQAALLALPHQSRAVPAGSYLIREHARPGPCLIMLEGFAMRSKLNSEGGRQIVAIQIPGDALDLQHLFLECADHNVQALTAASVIEIPRMDLQRLAETRPNILKAIVIDTLIEASILREWLLNVGRRDAPQRIGHLICEVAFRLNDGTVDDKHGYLLPLTQEQLGDATGLTSVHVNRTLKALEAKGLISRKRQHIVLESWSGLTSAADFNSLYLHTQGSQRRETPAL